MWKEGKVQGAAIYFRQYEDWVYPTLSPEKEDLETVLFD